MRGFFHLFVRYLKEKDLMLEFVTHLLKGL